MPASAAYIRHARDLKLNITSHTLTARRASGHRPHRCGQRSRKMSAAHQQDRH
jgi:hypothetical protein